MRLPLLEAFLPWAGEAFCSNCHGFTRMCLSGQVLVEFLELDKHPHPGDANGASSALGVPAPRYPNIWARRISGQKAPA